MPTRPTREIPEEDPFAAPASPSSKPSQQRASRYSPEKIESSAAQTYTLSSILGVMMAIYNMIIFIPVGLYLSASVGIEWKTGFAAGAIFGGIVGLVLGNLIASLMRLRAQQALALMHITEFLRRMAGNEKPENKEER